MFDILSVMIERIGPMGPALEATRLPKDEFLAAAERLCTSVVEGVVIHRNKGILLIRRDITDYFPNMWHVPGGYVMGRVSFEHALADILKKEIDLNLTGNEFIFKGHFHNPFGDPRGPMFHHVFQLRDYNVNAKDGQNDYFASMPPDIIPHHLEFLQKLGIVNSQGIVANL